MVPPPHLVPPAPAPAATPAAAVRGEPGGSVAAAAHGGAAVAATPHGAAIAAVAAHHGGGAVHGGGTVAAAHHAPCHLLGDALHRPAVGARHLARLCASVLLDHGVLHGLAHLQRRVVLFQTLDDTPVHEDILGALLLRLDEAETLIHPPAGNGARLVLLAFVPQTLQLPSVRAGQVDRLLAAALLDLDVELHLLVGDQGAVALELDDRLVHEDVFPARVGRDEAEAALPSLHGTGLCHCEGICLYLYLLSRRTPFVLQTSVLVFG
mmetsp:Transcript_22043/g.48369  ORF Transcript_22043/g.48369 Transcript_22043/m.48369 type:complete len:266 (-) Transcript_22043:241-1038(-)